MKIEVGKRYVRFDGTITPPLVPHPNESVYFAIDPKSGITYSTGEVEVSEHPQPHSLIKSYVTYTEAIPTEVLARTMGAATGTGGETPGGLHPRFATEENAGIEAVLNARGKTYGEFHKRAEISQELSSVMELTNGWAKLSSAQREALQMIQHKIARILNGDPLYLDSWVDIVGYAELGKKETERLGGK